MISLPVLYSFRRCPYAIRARMAIIYAGIPVEIREVELKNKPEHLLLISPKGTVPVLKLEDGRVIDESLDIMCWALAQHNPENWLLVDHEANQLIKSNDVGFKYFLDRYKYADRYPNYSQEHYRQQAEVFLTELESRLVNNNYLCGSSMSIADVAIFPFIRQFVSVDKDWFQMTSFQALNNWLQTFLTSELFGSVMKN